jgi:hypothetical protein
MPLWAGVAQRTRDDLGAAVMAVETGLGHEDSDSFVSHKSVPDRLSFCRAMVGLARCLRDKAVVKHCE